MKIPSKFVIGIVVLCIVIFFVTALASRAISPYTPTSSLKNSAFEGFNGISPVNYSTYPTNKTIDLKDNLTINGMTDPKSAHRIWGFDGLFGSENIPNNSLDIYSNAKGDLSSQCQNVSSNLTNSKGHLCLDANQLKMLTTRGGNQSGCGSQVGTCHM